MSITTRKTADGKRRYIVKIYNAGGVEHIGTFDTEQEAINEQRRLLAERPPRPVRGKCVYYEKVNKHFTVRIKGVYYGSYPTEAEAVTARDKFLIDEVKTPRKRGRPAQVTCVRAGNELTLTILGVPWSYTAPSAEDAQRVLELMENVRAR